MKALNIAVLCFWLLFSSASSADLTRSTKDFALLDHTGKFHQLSYYGDQRGVVLYSHGVEYSGANPDIDRFGKLQSEFSDDQVVFFMINAFSQDSRDSIAEQMKNKEARVPVLLDETQIVSRDLAITRLGEVLVIDAEGRRVLHRGGIDGLEALLRKLIAGHDPEPRGKPSPGPKIVFESSFAEKDSVSYTEEVVPILKENCVKCHREGAIAPWAMSSHEMIKGFSPMIREVVLTQRMPPGQIDTHVGRPIENVPGLTIEERKRLVSWIDAGSPKDGGADPLADVEAEVQKFSLGEPDIVLEVPPQSIPATGVIDYRYVPVPLNLDEDVWISGMEFLPGDREVLHHVIAYLTSPADKTAKASSAGSGQNIAGFAPGRQPDYFGEDSGRLIPRGSNLLLQMHYTTSGREAVDATKVGIFLHKKPPSYVMSGDVVGQRRFMIPPGAKEHKLEATQEIKRDALLYQFTPHMHFRGKYMSYEASYPDGSSELLLSVPKYNFNWQYSYRPQEPIFLPAGTKLTARGAMDNSDRNPANPDPSKPVFFGLQTMHEMFFGFVTLRYIGDTPESDSPALVGVSVGAAMD